MKHLNLEQKWPKKLIRRLVKKVTFQYCEDSLISTSDRKSVIDCRKKVNGLYRLYF